MNKGKQSIDRKFKNSKNDIKIDGNNNNTNNNIDKSTNYNTTNNYYLTEFDCHFPVVDSMKNSNNRTLLKSMVNKRIQVWAYAIDEYSRIPKENIIRYTVINLHNEDNYIADHIQLEIPYEIYDKDIRHKILYISGIVKEYNTSYGKKQTILANEIRESYGNNLYINKDYIKQTNPLSVEQNLEVLKIYKYYNPNEKFDLMMKYVNILDKIISSMPKDFITNYIINQYTINYDPDSMNRGNYYMLRNDEDSIQDITFLIISIIKKLSEGIDSINSIFKYINWIINDMQGLKEEYLECKKLKLLPTGKGLPFTNFCEKHNLNINKAYRFIMNRNNNFGTSVLSKTDAYENALQILYYDIIENRDE